VVVRPIAERAARMRAIICKRRKNAVGSVNQQNRNGCAVGLKRGGASDLGQIRIVRKGDSEIAALVSRAGGMDRDRIDAASGKDRAKTGTGGTAGQNF